jgi:transposase
MFASQLLKLPFAAVVPPPDPDRPQPACFVGLDLHKEYVTACIVDKDEVLLSSTRHIPSAQFPAWVAKHLDHDCVVVIEMTTHSWAIYDMLELRVHAVIVVHPPGMTGLMPKDAKTDLADAMALACSIANGSAYKHAIWVPPPHIRDLRNLMAARQKVVRMASRAKNRLHAILFRHQVPPPASPKDPFHPDHETFWMTLTGLSVIERADVAMNWHTIRFCATQAESFDTLIHEQALNDPAAIHLLQMPGFGATLAMTVLAAIGDIARFPTAKRLVGYAGLGGKIRQTGKKLWQGPITRHGRRELRWAMVQAASHALRNDARWKRAYEKLVPRIGAAKARVAIARRMLITVWYLLTRVETDHSANTQQVAMSLMTFAYTLGSDKLPGKQSVREWVRGELDNLGIGADVRKIRLSSRKSLMLPPSSLPDAPQYEVIEARPAYQGGCASFRSDPDPRTFEGRLLTGRSKPEGAKKKRPLASQRPKPKPEHPTG